MDDHLALAVKALNFLKSNLDDYNEAQAGNLPVTEGQVDLALVWLTCLAGIDAALKQLEDGLAKKTAVLTEFVDDIDAAGGVFRDQEGLLHPFGNDEWTDLADTYLKACEALNRIPLFGEDPDAGLDLDELDDEEEDDEYEDDETPY